VWELAGNNLANMQSMTILILEDEPAIMALICMVLSPLGYRILEATTGEEAIQRFEQSDSGIDLLIADVALPVKSGIRVALELRAVLPCLPIILTSGYPSNMWNEQDVAELSALASESIVTVQKPFLPLSLRETVRDALGMSSK
jgi:CheY-like chemotaxis protein